MKKKELYLKAFNKYLIENKIDDLYVECWNDTDSKWWRKGNTYNARTLKTFYEKTPVSQWIDAAFPWSNFEFEDSDMEWESLSLDWEELCYGYRNRNDGFSGRWTLSDIYRFFEIKINKRTRTL